MSFRTLREPSLQIKTAEYVRDGETLVLYVQGKWRGGRRGPDERAMLLVAVDGSAHRFPTILRVGRGGLWSGSFALPAWMQPHLATGASLAVDGLTEPFSPDVISAGDTAAAPLDGLPDPARNGARAPRVNSEPETPANEVETVAAEIETVAAEVQTVAAEVETVAAEVQTGPAAPPTPPEVAASPGPPSPRPATPPVGSSPDPAIAALRSELEARTGSESHLRGRLTETQAQLEAQAADRAHLETAQAELRREFDELRAAVERESAQRADFQSRADALAARVAEIQGQVAELSAARDAAQAERDQLARELASARSELAVSAVSRDAANTEAAGLRAELERLGARLATARDDAARNGELGDAESLLAEARALTASLRRRQVGPAASAGRSQPDG